jgi:hypothetical protein
MCSSVQRMVRVVQHETTRELLGLDGEPDESPENSSLLSVPYSLGMTSTPHDVRTKLLSQHVEIVDCTSSYAPHTFWSLHVKHFKCFNHITCKFMFISHCTWY